MRETTTSRTRFNIDLPEFCAVCIPARGGPIVGWAKRGGAGIHRSAIRFQSVEEAKRHVAFMNWVIGATEHEARAMLAGCMLGWCHPVRSGAVVRPADGSKRDRG